MSSLVVNSSTYLYPPWLYVALSRVKSLNDLVLNKKLNETRNYGANKQSLKWEENMKKQWKQKLSKNEVQKIMNFFIEEEEYYTYLSVI